MSSATPGASESTPDISPEAALAAGSGRSAGTRWPRRRPRIRYSIGLRLTLLALAFGLPFIAYVGIDAARQSSILREESHQRTLSLARLFAARVDDYVGDMISAVAVTSHGVVVDPAFTGANDAFLKRIGPDLPKSVNTVAVWTVDGRNVGATDPGTRDRGVLIGDREYFRAAVREKKMTIAGPLVSRVNAEPVVLFARPVMDNDGGVIGVVTASTRLRDLQWLLDLKGVAPPGTLVSLLNNDGIVLVRNIDPAHWIGTNILDVGRVREHIAAREGTDETNGQDGIPRISGFTQASRAPWHVFVGIPADAALSGLRANLLRTLAFGFTALLLGAAIAAYVGVRIARPLRRLAYDAMLLAHGKLEHRTSIAGEDEIGVLASTLNRMAQTVEERTRALEEKSAALEKSAIEHALITANVPVLIAYIDADQRFTFVNEYVRDIFGVAPDRLIGRSLRETLGEAVFARLEGRMREVQTGLPQTFEASFTPDGASPWFLVTCFPDYGDAQEVRGAYVVCQDITRRKEAEEALAASEKRIRLVTDNLPPMIAYVSADERYRFVNARSNEVFGLPPEAMLGKRVAEILSRDAYEQTKPHMDRACRGERVQFQRTVSRNGRAFRELIDYIPDRDASGNVEGFYALVQDITDVSVAQAKAEESEQRLRRITDNIPSMIGYIDGDRRYRFNNRYYEFWLNRPLSEITGQLVRDVQGAEAYASVGPNLDRAFAGERVDFDVEVPHSNGTRHVRGTYIPDLGANGKVIGVYTSSNDVTPLKEAERELERLAQHDTLTGLPNRHMFNAGISAALHRSKRAGTPVALLFLDIDGFKGINDTYGHATGDDMLREFARRLSASVRSTDLVARLAGDEFVVVLEGVHGREECRFIARKIIAAMSQKFHAGDAELRMTASIGIALGHGAAVSAETLLKRADSALYSAKGNGRNTYEIAI